MSRLDSNVLAPFVKVRHVLFPHEQEFAQVIIYALVPSSDMIAITTDFGHLENNNVLYGQGHDLNYLWKVLLASC